MYDRGKIVVDLRKLKANVLKFRYRIPKEVKLTGVVKADGYGHGAEEIAKNVKAFDSFAVATVEEGAALRAVTTKPILVLGYGDPAAAVNYGLTLSLWEKSQAKELAAAAGNVGRRVTAEIAVDTGMNRTGVKGGREFAELSAEIRTHGNLSLCGAYSHLYDGANESRSLRQLDGFLSATACEKCLPKHISATSRALDGRFSLSAVRLGIGMYGYGADFVKPCLSLIGYVVRVRRINAGEAVGYGGRYIALKPTYVATLSLGYADGLPRSMSGGDVIINGKKRKIIGNVCMDYCFAEVDAKTRAGDGAIFIGEENGIRITAEDVARRDNTICYEILTRLGRVHKEYIL